MSEEKRKSIRDEFRKYLKEDGISSDGLLKVLEDYRQSWEKERDNKHKRNWINNGAFYAGNHYVRDPIPSSSTYRVRLKENHINNIIARILSIIIQNMPITRVFPMSDDWNDKYNAETTELYVKYFWRIKKLESKFSKLVKYALVYGNGFVCPTFDPDEGGEIVLASHETESGEVETREYRGDVKIDIDDPFRIKVRPGIDELDDMYDYIRSIPTSREMMEEKYGSFESDSISAMNAYTGSIRKDDDNVMVHHYYHKPTSWFEEGAYICWAGNKIFRVRPATKSESKLNIIHLPFDKPMMSFWGLSGIDQLIDLQEQLNRAASMIIEARNLVARPRVIASQEAQIPGQSISDRPGEFIRYKLAGGPPRFEVPSFNFGEMNAHKQDLRNAISMVSGMTSASRGEIPAATRTALALQLVLEQDRSQFLPFIKSFHQSILDSVYKILMIVAENFDEEDPRVIKVEGKLVTTRSFHGGIVPSQLDMYLEDTNPLGWTSTGRIEQVGELIKMGVVKNENRALEMLKLNMPDPAYELQNIHRTKAQKENELLLKGEILKVGIDDEDPIHLDEHVKISASFEFKDLPQPVQDAINEHIAEHKNRLSALSAPSPQQNAPKTANNVLSGTPKQMASPNEGATMEQLLSSARG